MGLDSLFTDLFGFNSDPIWNVLIRFGVTLFVLYIIIKKIFYRYSKEEDKVFAFFLMGILFFLICVLLKNVQVQIGMTFGLFAVFALLSFRSKSMNIKTMSYFFTVIGVSVVNAMGDFLHPVRGPFLINLILILSVFLLEKYYQKNVLQKCDLVYDNLLNLSAGKEAELLKDLSSKLGQNVIRVEIKKMDVVKNQADLKIFYSSNRGLETF